MPNSDSEKLRYFQEPASGTLKFSIDGSNSLSFAFHKSIEIELYLSSVENVYSKDLKSKKQLEPNKIMPGRIISTDDKHTAALLNNRSVRIELKDVLSSNIDYKKQTFDKQETNLILVEEIPVSYLSSSDQKNEEKTAEPATQEVDSEVNLVQNLSETNKSCLAVRAGQLDLEVNMTSNTNKTNTSDLTTPEKVNNLFNFKATKMEKNVKGKQINLSSKRKRNMKKSSAVQPASTIKTGIVRSLLSNMSENLPEKKIEPREPESKLSNLKANGGVTCQYCGIAFSYKEAFLEHTKLSKLAGRSSVTYQCFSCLKVFSFKAHLEAHMIVHHIQQADAVNQKCVLYNCNYCDDKIKSPFGLKKHIMRHTLESEFKCCVCDKEFRLFKQLKLHYNHHSTEDKIQCRCCDKVFPNRVSLGQYKLTSSLYKDHKIKKLNASDSNEPAAEVSCPHCDTLFPDKQAFLNHRKLTKPDGSEVGTFQCGSCPKVFPFEAHLQAHVIVHHSQEGDEKPDVFKCTSCDCIFRNYHDLKKHILSHTGEIDFKCCVCGKEFLGLSALYSHYTDGPSRGKVRCTCCNQRFPNKTELSKHKLAAHPPNKLQQKKQIKKPGANLGVQKTSGKITCPHCNTLFPHQQAFSDHTKLRKFSGPSSVTFQCSGCPKVFLFKAHLQAHVIVHHSQEGDEKPDYKCSSCDHICKDYHDLKRHLMCHTGECDVKCCICDKEFRGISALNAHYVHHTSEDMVRCMPCDQFFPNKAALDQHKATHHPFSEDDKRMQTKIPDGKVTCQFCDTEFPHKKAFSDHTKIHKLSGPNSVTFRCSSCPKVFPFKAHLKAHMIVHHTECEDEKNILYKCDSCYHICKDYHDLKRHMMCHTEEFDEKCCACDKEFRSISALHAHYMHHKSGEIVRTTCSNKCFPNSPALDQHKLPTHPSNEYEPKMLGKKPDASINESKTPSEVPCPHCNTVFPSKKALANHTKTNKFDGPDSVAFQCSSCPKVFPFEAHLQAHVIVHHTQNEKPLVFKCSSCDHESKEFYDLKKHMMVHTGEFDVKCCICGKEFRELSALNAHYIHHTSGGMVRCTCCSQLFPNRAALGQHRAAMVEAKCHLCGEVYPNKTSRNQHYQLMHQHDILRCEKCTLLFSSQEELAAHMKRHQVNKKKPCHICGKLFSRIEFHMIVHRSEPGVVKGQHFICDKCPFMSYNRASFHRHLTNHSSEKPYKCSNCSKTFTHSTSLRRHLKSHSSFMPYECDVCGKRCKEIGNLRVHQRIHSAVKHYSCPYCPQTFNYKNSLDKHIKNKHVVARPCSVSVAGPSSEALNIFGNSGAQAFTTGQTLNLTIVDGLLVPDEQQADMPNALAKGVKCYIVDTETLSTIYEVKKEPIEVLVEQAMEVEDVASIIDVKHSYS